jgi:tetratricopeptide (TPR) repeat protein
MLGQLYIAQRRLDEARAEFETIARKRPNAVSAHTMVALLLQAQGKVAEAQQRYEQIVASSPQAGVASNNLAWIYAEQGNNLDRALNLAQAAKAELPEVAEVDDTLGFVYYKKELYTLAIPPYEAAVQRVPNNADYRYRLGMAYVKAGDWQKGKQALSEALRLKPDFAGADEARKALAQIGG